MGSLCLIEMRAMHICQTRPAMLSTMVLVLVLVSLPGFLIHLAADFPI